ncbi:unnamed protein product [Prunus armeniaca]
MLGLRYALGFGKAFDLQDNKRSVRPRAPVWYRPKTLRCLSRGRCASCLEFRCRTVDSNCGTATCPWGWSCPNRAIGRNELSPPSSLVTVLGRGLEIVFGRKCYPTVR